MRKNEKGITLITLAITVAVILLLGSVGTYHGLNLYRESKRVAFITELELIQRKTNETYEKLKIKEERYGIPYIDLGGNAREKVEAFATTFGISPEAIEEFNYFNKELLESDLAVSGVKREIIINFNTREIYDINGVKTNEGTIYCVRDTTGGSVTVNHQSAVKARPTYTISGERIDLGRIRINFTITYNSDIKEGTIQYKKTGDASWQSTDNTYVIVEDGYTYELRVIDRAGNISIITELHL